MVRVVASVGRQVESNAQALLPCETPPKMINRQGKESERWELLLLVHNQMLQRFLDHEELVSETG